MRCFQVMSILGPTSGRWTSAVFGNWGWMLQEPYYSYTRIGSEIGGGDSKNENFVEFVPGIGWRLKSNVVTSSVREIGWAQDGIIASAGARTVSNLVSYVYTQNYRDWETTH